MPIATHKRLGLGGAILLAIIAAAIMAGGSEPSAASAAHANRPPNIVLIRTDDQTDADFSKRIMPRTMRLLADHGTRFTQSIVTTPQCCPSRAATLTGQYGHNNGVMSNRAGYPKLHQKSNVLPGWLQAAGYRTAHFGKWMKGYGQVAPTGAEVAPHWDDWHTTFVDRTLYFNYQLSNNGRRKRYGHKDSDYVTRVLDRKATRFARNAGKKRKPFYLQLDERAPHATTPTIEKGPCPGHAPQPDPRDKRKFRNKALPDPPSFNEADVHDKPAFLQKRRLDADTIDRMTTRYRCTLESLRAVDRGVGAIYKALKRTGALHRTAFIFTSDNGFLQGEHRISSGKSLPYEESIRVPLVIRLPGGHQPAQVSDPVANIDLTATILDLANARPCTRSGNCRILDGRSLVGLASGSSRGWPADRGLLMEYHGKAKESVCDFSGIRTANSSYVQYRKVWDQSSGRCQPTDAVELYDLASDPFELNNLCNAGDRANCPDDAQQRELKARLRKLRHCAGIRGRDRHLHGRPFCE